MIVDASNDCNQVTFHLGADQSVTRQWNIKVTQFECGNEMGGPCGCLQYFTGQSGTIASFNFPTNLNFVNNASNIIYNSFLTSLLKIFFEKQKVTSISFNNLTKIGKLR